MAEILKGKKVFLDTGVFSQAVYDFKNPVFSAFRKLCKNGDLILLTTSITKGEIKRGIKLLATQSYEAITRASNALHSIEAPEVTAVNALAQKLNPSDFSQGWFDSLETFLSDCEASTIPIPASAVENVFKLYFERKPPFGGSKKKAEFPDAFTLEALKSVPTPNHEVVYVVSADQDFKNACIGCASLVHLDSLPHLLSLFHRHQTTVKQIKNTLQTNWNNIEVRLEEILESLSGEITGWNGSVQIDSICLLDILDTLIIACEEKVATVTFVCFVEIGATLELFTKPDEPSAFQGVDQQDQIYITLVFQFDPNDTSVFHETSYWAPQTLKFDA